jgi:hypothetical protein
VRSIKKLKSFSARLQAVVSIAMVVFMCVFLISCRFISPPADPDIFAPGEYSELLADEPRSEDYNVWINGVEAIVYVARVQDGRWAPDSTGLDFGGNYSFVGFDLNRPVEIKIQSENKLLNNTIFRPDNAKVKHLKKSDNEITFTIDRPMQLSIEPDGKNGPLLLFANPVDDFISDINDTNLIYFGPGIHRPETTSEQRGRPSPPVIILGDNKTLYLAEGAILKAGIRVEGDNVTICGRGIICGNEQVWRQYSRNLILVDHSNNVVVKDIILRGCATWTMPLRNSHNITIDNVKIVGGRAQNDDGINPVNSSDVLISNCFIRTDDDCIALKGVRLPPYNEDVERITVENSILWCDRARIFLLGHESRAEYMRDLTFRNIDIIHFSMTAFLLEPGEEMRLENTIFEDFRINGEGQGSLIRLKPTVNRYMRNRVPGYINNITFKKIDLTGSDGPYKIELIGADEKHNVSGIHFKNVSMLGSKLKPEYKNLEVGDFVSDYTLD